MKFKILVFLLPLFLFFQKSSKAQDRETRNISGFSRLKASDGIDLVLIKADKEMLELETRNYNLDDVVTELNGDQLVLYKQKRSWGNNRVQVKIYYQTLTKLNISGGSDVKTENLLSGNEFYIEASGGSDLELEVSLAYLECRLSGGSDADLQGRTEFLDINASGGSDIDAHQLKASRGRLNISGGSDAEVNFSETVDINASGGSDVELMGGASVSNLKHDRSSDISVR
ncbi:MAG: head GIN domain-containing protein [Candidatus Cyclobacteriaceae bacterium M3_2C_046]